MASPARRAVLWTILPVLAVLNLLVWTGGDDTGGSGSTSDSFSGIASPFRPNWIHLDDAARRRLDAGFVPILVLREADGTPAAHAPVWLDEDAWFRWRWYGMQIGVSPSPARLEDARTDLDGIAWLPRCDWPSLMMRALDPAATTGLAFAGNDLLSTSSNVEQLAGAVAVTIILRETPMYFAVDVRDASGQPVPDAPVFLIDADESSRVPLWPHPDGEHWLSFALPDFADEPRTRDGSLLRLAAGLSARTSVPIHRRHFRGEAIRIVLEPHGHFAVHLAATGGAIDLESFPITVREVAKDESEWTILAPRVDGGVSKLAGVPLGKRWRIGAPLLGDGRWFWVETEGPAREAEIVPIELGLEASSRVVHGVLVGAEDLPARCKRLDGTLERGTRYGVESFRIECDGAGAFRLHVPILADDPWETAVITAPACQHFDVHPSGWELDLTAGTADLGTIAPRPTEPAGEIRIVDADGAGIPDATVSMRPLNFQGRDQPGPWTEDVASNGRLELRSARVYGESPYEIVVYHPHYLPAGGVLNDDRGTTTIRMERAARVRGRVLLPEHARVVVQILPASAHQPSRHTVQDDARMSATSPLGYFDCGPLPAGVMDLELRVAGIRYARAGAVALQAGVTAAPAAFQDLDLRSATPMQIQLIRLPKNVRRDQISVEVEFADGTREAASGLSLLLPAEARRVRVTAEGCNEEWIDAPQSLARVQLRKSSE